MINEKIVMVKSAGKGVGINNSIIQRGLVNAEAHEFRNIRKRLADKHVTRVQFL